MLHTIILSLLIPVMALLHRVRGGGLFDMPVKGTYVLWPIVGLLAYAAGSSWQASIAWAIGYLIWILPAWMAIITRALGIEVPADQVMASGWQVTMLEDISFGHPDLACFMRAYVYVLPLMIVLSILNVPCWPLYLVPMLFLPFYWVGYRLRPTDMSSVAEWLVGASWGAALLLTRVA